MNAAAAAAACRHNCKHIKLLLQQLGAADDHSIWEKVRRRAGLAASGGAAAAASRTGEWCTWKWLGVCCSLAKGLLSPQLLASCDCAHHGTPSTYAVFLHCMVHMIMATP
jgi:hypothetical protein